VLTGLDRICRAPAAYDLATYAAHFAFGRPGDGPMPGAVVDSLVAGYDHRPAGLRWHLAGQLPRRTAVPFRFQDDQWPAATAELLRLAAAVLR